MLSVSKSRRGVVLRMNVHETLAFIEELHGYMERTVSNKGPWCWPTRELLAYNLRQNEQCFAGGIGGWRDTLARARKKGWIRESGCSAHCHAFHVELTAAGREALRLMNETGCHQHNECAQQHRKGFGDFRLKREAA